MTVSSSRIDGDDCTGNRGVQAEATLRAILQQALAAAADLIVPPCCLVCRAPLGAHHLLCAPCWREVHFIRPPLCDVLGMPLPFDTGGRMVSAAARGAPAGLRPGARRGPLLAAPCARSSTSSSMPTGTMPARCSGAGWPRPGAICRGRRRHRAGAAQPLAAAVAPIQPGRHPRRWSCRARPASPWTRTCCSGRAPRQTQVGLTRDQRRRNVAGAFARAAQPAGPAAGPQRAADRRRDHHRRHGGSLRPRAQAGRGGPGRRAGPGAGHQRGAGCGIDRARHGPAR